MIKGGNNILPKDKPVSEEEITGKMDSMIHADYEKQLTNQLLAYSLFVYQVAPDEMLNRYLEIVENPNREVLVTGVAKQWIRHCNR